MAHPLYAWPAAREHCRQRIGTNASYLLHPGARNVSASVRSAVGPERRIARIRGEGEMQFTSALPEQLHFLRINATEQLIEQRPRGRDFILKIGFATKYPLVIAADCVQGERPDIPFVSNGALQ